MSKALKTLFLFISFLQSSLSGASCEVYIDLRNDNLGIFDDFIEPLEEAFTDRGYKIVQDATLSKYQFSFNSYCLKEDADEPKICRHLGLDYAFSKKGSPTSIFNDDRKYTGILKRARAKQSVYGKVDRLEKCH